jgi:mannosyltransferase
MELRFGALASQYDEGMHPEATLHRQPPTEPSEPVAEPGASRTIERWALAASIAILFAVAATRLDSTALWADEAWSLAAANRLTMSLTASTSTMGAYYVLLWGWTRVGTATPWLRLLSTVFAACSVVVVQLIARRVGGRRLAILAPIVLVCSPMFLWTATEARGYALEILLTTVCWYAALRLTDPRATTGDRTRWTAISVIAAGLGPLSHGLFLAQLIAIGAWTLLHPDRRRRVVAMTPAFLAGLVVTSLLWNAGLSSAGAVIAVTPSQMFASLRGWYLASVAWIGWVALVVLIVGLFGGVAAATRLPSPGRRALRLLAATWVVVPLVTLLAVRGFHTVWADYYLSPVAPGLALVLAAGMLKIGDVATRPSPDAPEPGPARNVAIAAALVVLLAFSLVHIPRRPVEGWREAAHLVAHQARPTDAILFGGGEADNPMETRPPFEAAWREVAHPVVPIGLSPRRRLGDVQRVDHYLSPARAREASLRYDRVWVVDYRGVVSGLHITDRPPFDSHFRLASDHRYAGQVRVQLYVRTR